MQSEENKAVREQEQKQEQTQSQHQFPASPLLPVPEIRLVHSNIAYQEAIHSSVYNEADNLSPLQDFGSKTKLSSTSPPRDDSGDADSLPPPRSRLSIFHRSKPPSDSTTISQIPQPPHATSLLQRRTRGEKRFSHFLHLDRGHAGTSSRDSSRSSVNIPADLPQISNVDGGDEQDREAQWETRATLLIQQSPRLAGSGSSSSLGSLGLREGSVEGLRSPPSPSPSPSLKAAPHSLTAEGYRPVDENVNIQEAIRLHEAGELEASTNMFGRLADSSGTDNSLSQVLFGLALRHGWGCAKDPERAIAYLTAAASNAASIESEALRAGVKKGGAAKGELVLAIYELANCFRNGWGVQRDPAAARQYYETAANLGDTDAMNEAAWCYLEGFGGKKDKFTAARYYRLAEENGNKTLGNSWIWKDKYTPKLK